jgi:hypothetical protein
MAIAIYFPLENVTKAQYDEIDSGLKDAGAGTPKARTYHCAFGGDDSIQVFDVWDSQEDFDAFGETLMPLIEKAGVTMPQPVIAEVHNVITG